MGGESPVGKAQRRKRGLQTMPDGLASLAKANRHACHVDVRKLGQPRAEVGAQTSHMKREIESAIHNGSFWG
jgi:hypothetical protein